MNQVKPNPTPVVPEVETPETVQLEATAPTGTEQTETVKTEQPKHEVETVDYRAKFIESSKGAHQLLQEKKELERQLAEARGESSPAGTSTHLPNPTPEQPTTLYPGFEELDPSEQTRVTAFAESVRKAALADIQSNPALAFAEKQYNETRWEEGFAEAVSEYPELSEMKSDFKSKYFHPGHVPDNIGDIIKTMAKAELFDKARAIGAEEAAQVAQRVELEDPTGGDKEPPASRSLADWQHLAATNPTKFAELKPQYEADLASGKLQE